MPADQPIQLGRRIVVWGATGSGKTTVARRLGESLDLGVVELDSIRHANGWDSTGWDDFRAILTQRLDGFTDGWVCEGSYHQVMDVYLSRAESLIWLHIPWRLSFWRLLKRTVVRARDQQPLYNEHGPHESWRQTFLSSKSILWWSINSHVARNRVIPQRIAALPPHIRVYELRTARTVDAFLSQLRRTNPSTPT